MNNQSLEKLQQLLSDFLGPQIQEVINSYVDVTKNNKLRNLKNCYLTKPEVEQIVRLDI